MSFKRKFLTELLVTYGLSIVCSTLFLCSAFLFNSGAESVQFVLIITIANVVIVLPFLSLLCRLTLAIGLEKNLKHKIRFKHIFFIPAYLAGASILIAAIYNIIVDVEWQTNFFIIGIVVIYFSLWFRVYQRIKP